MRPSLPIHPLTACSTVRTGTGDSAVVSIAMQAAYGAGRAAGPHAARTGRIRVTEETCAGPPNISQANLD
ncbi:hypothetical protein GCM10010177_38700 [Actinomadura citrea]|nr:hypothetical protein GCM10010177_38700 [Actinomadura citrea]